MLLDKDLGVLADGVAEGRRIFANTLKYVLMATSSNFGNMFSAAGASLFLGFLPMLLWHQALKWRFRQKLSATERALAEVKAAAVVATPPRAAPEPGDMPPPLGALPLDPAPPVPAPPKAT